MKLMVLPEVMKRTRRSKATIYRMIKKKQFPAQVKQGESSFWVESEIETYMQSLTAGRQASQPTSAS
jgi:prophage regulatory protein